MPYNAILRPFRRLLRQLNKWFLLPETAVVDYTRRRTARLISFLALILVIATLLEQYIGGNMPWWVPLIALLTYGLSRTRYHTIASVILAVILCVPPYLDILHLSEPTAIAVTYPLVWLALPLFLVMALFPLRWGIFMSVLNMALMLLLPWLNPALNFTHILGALGFMGTLSLLLLSLMSYRNSLEAERETQLITSTERLQLALDSAQMGIWTWDTLSNQVVWSEQVYKLFQQSEQSFSGTFQDYITLVHPDDQAEVMQAITTTLSGGNSIYMVIHRIILADGQIRWLEAKGQVYRDAQGKPVRMAGTVSDITLSREMEMLMQTQARQNEVLAEIAQLLAVATQDYERILQIVVQQAALFLGDGASIQTISADGEWIELAAVYNPNSNYVRIFNEMIDTGPRRVTEGIFGHVYRTGEAVFMPVVNQEKLRAMLPPAQRPFLNQLPYHSLILCPLRPQGQFIGVLGIARHSPGNPYTLADYYFLRNLADRTALAIVNARLYTDLQAELAERRRIESERETLINELEAKNAELERFTYTVSHDLKSPLVTVKGFLGFLEQDINRGDTVRLQADLQHIHDAADKMQSLLNDLLELSRIGRLINTPQAISFAKLITDTLDLIAGRIQTRGVEVIVQPDLPVVYGDQARLTEVLQNLIDNAVKFMGDQPTPRIDIGMCQIDQEAAFFVQDNGIGIPQAYHHEIFGLFNRLDTTIEGTGIGLSLVKRIIEVHGGRIWVESSGIGQGTTFYFTLPMQPPL